MTTRTCPDCDSPVDAYGDAASSGCCPLDNLCRTCGACVACDGSC